MSTGNETAILATIAELTTQLNNAFETAFRSGLRVTVNTHALASLHGGPERLSLKVWKPLLEIPSSKPSMIDLIRSSTRAGGSDEE